VACKMRRVRGDRGAFPPSARLDVLSMATRKPTTYHCPATHWSRQGKPKTLELGAIP